jgi:tetratricopeptide (TPR) repeat protein
MATQTNQAPRWAPDIETLVRTGLEALHAKDWATAVANFERVIAHAPHRAAPYVGMARGLRELGRVEDALRALATALEHEPDDADALNNLGNLKRQRGELEGALALFERARARRPGDIIIRNNYLATLADLGRRDDVIAARAALVQAAPDDAQAWIDLSDALNAHCKRAAAVAAAKRATVLSPGSGEAWAALSHAENALGAHFEAVESAARATTLRPGARKPRLALSQALTSSGWLNEGLKEAESLYAADPCWEAEIAVSRAAFLSGDFAKGFAHYEQRFRLIPKPLPNVPRPRWRGEDVAGKTIMLVAEQGIGDSLNFARYAGEIAARGGRCILHLQKELASLFSRLPHGVEYHQLVDIKDVDFWAPLLSAPLALQAFTPPPAAMITAPTDRTIPHSVRSARGLKVGLVFAGNPDHTNDSLRSIGLEPLIGLLGVSGAHFFSLQHGKARESIAALSVGPLLHDLAPHLKDWGDTAAAIEALDLVISVDSAPAHLAGALGKPVWMLTPFCPDWRWGFQGDTTPWYPSMKLYRQSKPRRWDDVLERVRRDLEGLAAR